jgi:hypothetical protein
MIAACFFLEFVTGFADPQGMKRLAAGGMMCAASLATRSVFPWCA